MWEAWDKGEIDDRVAWLAWWLLAFKYQNVETMTDEQIDQELRQLLKIEDDADVHKALETKQ